MGPSLWHFQSVSTSSLLGSQASGHWLFLKVGQHLHPLWRHPDLNESLLQRARPPVFPRLAPEGCAPAGDAVRQVVPGARAPAGWA